MAEILYMHAHSTHTYNKLATLCRLHLKNPHMLNAVPLSLRINRRGFLKVSVVSKISANLTPLEKSWLRPCSYRYYCFIFQ